MTQNHRRVHHKWADFPMLIVMNVRPANTDGVNFDTHIVRAHRLVELNGPKRQLVRLLEH